MLALGHAVSAGTAGRSTWMLVMLVLLTAPIVFAFTYRMLPRPPAPTAASAISVGACSGASKRSG